MLGSIIQRMDQTTSGGGSIGGIVTGGTSGSVLYVNSSGQLSQDNPNFYYDDTNHRLGLLTSAPTHTLTIGTGGGFATYQTADQTINYSRVLSSFVTLNTQPTYQITTQNAGTVAVPAAIQINAGGIFTTWDQSASAQGTSSKIATGIGGTGVVGGAGLISFQGSTLQATAGTQNFIGIVPTVNQTGTAGSNILYISPFYQAIGSGSQFLINVGTNTASNGSGTHSTSFNVTTGGNVSNSGTITAGGLITAGAGFAGVNARMALGAAGVTGTQLYATGAVSTGTNFGNTGGSAASFAIGSATISSTIATGTVALAGANIFGQPTFASSGGATTLTDVGTIYVAGPPVAGTNVTITRGWAMYYNAGGVRFSPSATTYPSINVPSGTAPTTPNNGDIWNDSTRVSLVTNIGGNTIYNRGSVYIQTADQTIANTTTATSLFSSGVGSRVFAANTLTPGKTINLNINGIESTTAVTAPTLIITVKLGTTTLATANITNLAAGAANLAFQIWCSIVIRTNGATGTCVINGKVEYETGFLQPASRADLNNGGATATIDTTIANTLDVTWAWSVASASNTAKATANNIDLIA